MHGLLRVGGVGERQQRRPNQRKAQRSETAQSNERANIPGVNRGGAQKIEQQRPQGAAC